jgi:hypothetical protein
MTAWLLVLALDYTLLSGVPTGWLAGGKPGQYVVAVDAHEAQDGHKSLRLESVVANPDSGYVTQIVNATRYRGKRIRLSGWLKTENTASAALWLSCNDDKWYVLNADVMSNRLVHGTTPFTRYDLVIDIPDKAKEVRFGAMLNGTGKIWIDDFHLDEVDATTPVTGAPPSNTNETPTNLSFEH